MTDVTNIVAFEPRPKQAPPFQFVEVRLRQDCSLQVNAVDVAGDITTFEYRLAAPATARDLERLLAGWNDWRGSSTVAS